MGETAQDVTNVTSLGSAFIVVMGFLTWILPRRYALIPLLATTCYMPLGQQVITLGLHFHFVRILLLVGAARVIVRREFAGLRLSSMDKLFLWWVFVSLTLGTLVDPSSRLFINRLGTAYNAVGVYFVVRCLVK